jgi:predicted CopG family antitoxin
MVKPVSLSNEAYEVLSKMKSTGESFSDVVLRLAEKDKKKFNVADFAGKWADIDVTKMKELIAKDRKRFKLRTVKF